MLFISFILGLPLLASCVLFFTYKNSTFSFIKMGSHLSFLLALGAAVFLIVSSQKVQFSWLWIQAFPISFGFEIGNLEMLMLVLVLLIALLVSIFSAVYMHQERRIGVYYAYLQFFVFAMLSLIVSSNLLQMYIFWELVGFSSYLLIGFWHEKPAAVWASRKAFMVNRVGDVCFLVGILGIYQAFGTMNFTDLHTLITLPHTAHTLSWAGACVFVGAMAKSAQFPLHIWLPSAMEGPTPISALIHAATMVVAGVFLSAKMLFFFTNDVQLFISVIGATSMLLGAFWASLQTDIKKLLAYSTISQLGLMMLGMGAGAYEASLLHLFTHAFFKAGLFLSAGAIIHQLHHIAKHYQITFDAQDTQLMGGLGKKMPYVFVAYTICMLSLIGFPFFSGFLSKDAIFLALYQKAQVSAHIFDYLVLIIAFLSSFLTAFYILGQWKTVFLGESRVEKQFPQIQNWERTPKVFVGVLLVLATLSVGFLFSLHPFLAEESWMWQKIVRNKTNILHTNAYAFMLVAFLPALLGIWVALVAFETLRERLIFMYKKINFSYLHSSTWIKTAKHFFVTVIWIEKNMIDAFINAFGKIMVVLAHVLSWVDRRLIDGFVRGLLGIGKYIGAGLRVAQGRDIQQYVGLTLLVFVLLLLFVFLKN